MADSLDAEIQSAREEFQLAEADAAAARAHVVECDRRAEMKGVRLRALERAAELRPLRSEAQRSKPDASGSRGRQPGAISRTWRSILATTAARYPRGAEEAQIAEIARDAGLSNVRPKDVRDRMTSYEAHGYVEPALNGWRVTLHALTKFSSADHADNGTDSADDDMETADAA